MEETEEIEVEVGNLDKVTKIWKGLKGSLHQEIIDLIREFFDIFAWDPKDMPGIPKGRSSMPNLTAPRGWLYRACRIFRLVNKQCISKKINDKWRICVDYFDLNRACPKDFYPLPNIDQLIDATVGNELLSFMDTLSGYNQIKMDNQDWKKNYLLPITESLLLKACLSVSSAWATF